jgi:hypothetical protein
MKIAHIILGFFALVAVVFESYLGVFSLVWFLIQVILLSLLVGLFLYSVTSSPTKNYRTIVIRSAFIMMAIIGMFITIIGGFITYHNTYPAALSDVTLSDGSGSVVFVQMSHIANEEFYRQKNIQLQALSQAGYTILVEWVRPGSSDNQAKFDAYMWFQFTDTLYSTIALLAGFESQDNDALYTWISTWSLTSVDISIDDIVWLIGDSAPLVSWEIPDIEKEFSGALQNISHQDKKLLNYAFRWLLNWTLKNSWDIETTLMEWDKAWVFRAIISKRNDPIVDYIRTHPGEKIVIVYGALHFNWVYAWLQKLSDNWKIVRIEHTYPYR